MCSPFGEVGNILNDEPHSTRIRALILWRILKGYDEWSRDIGRLLYESTLDSVSQAWCINHYPVADYIIAARADIFDAGVAPTSVADYAIREEMKFNRPFKSLAASDSDVIFYPGDSIAGENLPAVEAILKLLVHSDLGVAIPKALHDCGGLAYCLGREELAKGRAVRVVESVKGYSKILVDGPLSYWMLKRIYPRFGVSLPEDVEVWSILDFLLDLLPELPVPKALVGGKVYLVGSEFSRLTNKGYASFRELISRLEGVDAVESKDVLEWAAGSGAGGALHISAPRLAAQVSEARLDEARKSGASHVVCDSALDVSHMKSISAGEIAISTLPELLCE
jgi:Fe-S oxidoreductase